MDRRLGWSFEMHFRDIFLRMGWAGWVCLVGAGELQAQVTVTRTVIQNGQPVQITSPANAAVVVPPVLPGASSAPVDAAATQLREQNLQQLEQLSFSRVPSVVFEAWRTANLPAVAVERTSAAPELERLPPAPPDAALSHPQRFARWARELAAEFALGSWVQVAGRIQILPAANRDKLIRRMLDSLAQDVPADELSRLRMQQQGRGQDPRSLEKHQVAFSDVFELGRMSSQRPLSDETLAAMGRAISAALELGQAREQLFEVLDRELAAGSDASAAWIDRRQAARLLVFANQIEVVDRYLPELDAAIAEKDFEALNILSAHYHAAYQSKPRHQTLEQAWRAALAVLAESDFSDEQNFKAIAQTVELAGKVRKELGQAWLNESFTAAPERGIAILGAIGRRSATALQQLASDPAQRIQLLKLQNDSVNALLATNLDRAKEWRSVLELLASNWLREAAITYSDDQSTSLGPRMRRDMYGNIFYYDERMGNMPYRSAGLAPIPTAELIESRPSDGWLELLSPASQPKYWISLAQLYLKVGEEALSFPYIERLGQGHPRLVEDLVKEFIGVWTRNHDPNSERNRSDYYMFMYGFESRAESIPLTRSKQVRNLAELSELVPRLRELNRGELDPDLLVPAFLTCHSFAEVYKTEDLEKVFGPLPAISPKIIARLAQKMRENLAMIWRDVEVQKNAKTKRTRKELEAEVLRGYAAARELLANANQRHPGNADLLTLHAAILHDENNYQTELKPTSEHAGRRRAAFEAFAQAAQAYQAGLPGLEPHEYSTEVYERWFYAALGACDLNLVDEKQLADPTEFDRIAAALRALPAPHDQWHLARFANLMFNRMSNAKPAVKARYLRGGFAIVGDHPQARQARQVFDYYNDLVTEIQFETAIDGSPNVGQQPFGLFVNLVHTREIERESGGFGRYLQNQNNNNMFYYNYGRPLENYRDKFEEFVRLALGEHFEVLSVTFQVPEVKSRATDEPGWRSTPYAYILAKARGPQVDKIPPLKIDLDFLDTSGYAILPIESPSLPVVAHLDKPDPRPMQNLSLTQILDERRAAEGELIVEIRAQGQGLILPLAELFKSLEFEQFDLTSVEDNGVSVSRFDPEATENLVLSERNWLVHLKAQADLTERPTSFSFLQPQFPVRELVYQRYNDADLAAAEPTVVLQQLYGEPPGWGGWRLALAGAGSLIALALIYWVLRRQPNRARMDSRDLPEGLSPFKAIAVLQGLRNSQRLSAEAQVELEQTIAALHESYFDESPSPAAVDDLKQLTERWLSQV